jgi:hypothetical protein
MQTLEIQAEVDQNHEVHFTLPNSWKSHKVKLIVIETVDANSQQKNINLEEINKINKCAEQLNKEMDDALSYQISI